MTIVEELVREVETLKRKGASNEEILSVTDAMIQEWNQATLQQMRIQEMVKAAVG